MLDPVIIKVFHTSDKPFYYLFMIGFSMAIEALPVSNVFMILLENAQHK